MELYLSRIAWVYCASVVVFMSNWWYFLPFLYFARQAAIWRNIDAIKEIRQKYLARVRKEAGRKDNEEL